MSPFCCIGMYVCVCVCVLHIVADVNNAKKLQHETLIGFQVIEQTHNSKSIIFNFKAP